MSTIFARRMVLGVAAAVAVATLSGCGGSTAAKDKTHGGGTQPSPSASKSAPKGGGAAF